VDNGQRSQEKRKAKNPFFKIKDYGGLLWSIFLLKYLIEVAKNLSVLKIE